MKLIYLTLILLSLLSSSFAILGTECIPGNDQMLCNSYETCFKTIEQEPRYLCCPYRGTNVTLCENLTCCPEGYQCDLENMKCIAQASQQ